MNHQAHFYPLLKGVSRSFYLTLRVLPSAVRKPIGLAYLLARATDTIADTQLLPVDKRLVALRRLCEGIESGGRMTVQCREFVGQQSDSSEAELLSRIPELLAVLADLPQRQRELIRELLRTITRGQELDLVRFAGGGAKHVVALKTEAELDEYTYLVAGCVGPFWTRLCREQLFPRAGLNDEQLLADAECFGKGLQLVNILRDLASDLRMGRCYLPSDALQAKGLAPTHLLDSTQSGRFSELYSIYLQKTEDHLAKGWRYTNALPRSSVRVVLACAWPILIGLRTLRGLSEGNPLDVDRRFKVGRSEVRGILARTIWVYPRRKAWQRLWDWAGRETPVKS